MSAYRHSTLEIIRAFYDHPAVKLIAARLLDTTFDIRVFVDRYERDVVLHLEEGMRKLALRANRPSARMPKDQVPGPHDLRVFKNGEQLDYLAVIWGKVERPRLGGYVGPELPWFLVAPPALS